jgi:N-acetyl-gamma-glutamylphosphate reductase
VGVAADTRTGILVATCAIDNLLKGAAGQAVQAMNAALSWPEPLGLDLIGG